MISEFQRGARFTKDNRVFYDGRYVGDILRLNGLWLFQPIPQYASYRFTGKRSSAGCATRTEVRAYLKTLPVDSFPA